MYLTIPILRLKKLKPTQKQKPLVNSVTAECLFQEQTCNSTSQYGFSCVFFFTFMYGEAVIFKYFSFTCINPIDFWGLYFKTAFGSFFISELRQYCLMHSEDCSENAG